MRLLGDGVYFFEVTLLVWTKLQIMTARFKLCTFDVTNTLLKFRIPVGEQYAKVGRIYGVHRDPQQIGKSFLANWKTMNQNHPNYGQTTELSSNSWWKELVRRAFTDDSNKQLTDNELDSISGHLYDLYKGSECWKVEAGAKSLLKLLKDKGVMLGVISNFDERLDCVLKSNELHLYFEFILGSYDVGVAKPNRKIFELALGKAPFVDSSEALHIGDNILLDYLAAKEAGWNALLLQHKDLDKDLLKKVDPYEIVSNVDQIREYILL
ncbi:hypothetical protein JTE90_020932 [Oedothorax gibbosus]|uniref:Rhythmically expressed gene 2 protein n=1 Tax=Oedothorax gibbosus TaxID=931172 RepID=A0AAV6VNH0_9ARAC|nr:hypothetical protein JTE90_020932 [Oedothorax gibbosus]